MASPTNIDTPSWYQDAEKILLDFMPRFIDDLKQEDQVLDIGCGNTVVTTKLLWPKLAHKVRHLIAVDADVGAMEFHTKLNQNEGITFEELDVTCKSDVQDFVQKRGTFKMVFSFFAYEWYSDNEDVLRNIKMLMAPGGQCLLTFIANSPIYTMLRNVAKIPEYESQMQDYHEFIPQLHNSETPGLDFSEYMKRAGLEVLFCEDSVERKMFSSNKYMQDFVIYNIRTFIPRIHPVNHAKFKSDCLNNLIEIENLGGKQALTNSFTYTVVTAYGRNPASESPESEGASSEIPVSSATKDDPLGSA